jgi:hypothetical protein
MKYQKRLFCVYIDKTMKKQFELNSISKILLAYLVSAIIGGGVLGIEIVVLAAFDEHSSSFLKDPAGTFIWSAFGGGFLSLVAELLLVTPFLVLFHRFQWRWLNRWSGTIIGFFIGATLAFFISLSPVEGDLDVAMGYFSRSGLPTLGGWIRAGTDAIIFGLVGGGCALAFWVFAIRPIPLGNPSERHHDGTTVA